jgi:tRNA nucleotidyltransferase (CCA-adding enzyme)
MLSREQAFKRLRRNLELTALQDKTVATRQQKVREAVAAQLTVVEDFLTGSYRRQTLIGPLNEADVDIVVVLDRSYRERGERGERGFSIWCERRSSWGTSGRRRSAGAASRSRSRSATL